MTLQETPVKHSAWNKAAKSTYWDRMHQSLGDKMKMLSFIENPRNLTILEVGFGDGALLDFLHSEGANVYGVDANPVTIKKARKKKYVANLRQGMANDVPAVFSGKKFDVIIMCSVIHEIYSYGEGMNSVNRFLKIAKDILSPGGYILLRDGVAPEDGDKPVILQLSEKWSRLAHKYQEMHPFPQDYDMTHNGGGEWIGSLAAATSMMYTVNWGEESLYRESQELNQIATEEGFASIFDLAGFDCESNCYFNPDYLQYLEKDACIRTPEGEKLPYPDTNIVLKSELR